MTIADAMSTSIPLVDMAAITKRFPGGTVLHGVNFRLAPGEVHALIGQNGAGKSTLMKVLAGLYSDYDGDIRVSGQPVRLDSPRKAIESGIALIHQEFSLVPSLTIAENILLGREPTRGALLRKRDITATAARRLADVGLDLPLRRPLSSVGVAVQQQTEIAKALSMDAGVLVMDEPTARLSAGEKYTLFRIIRDLASRRVGVVYISHFLEEVFEIADRVTVLRDGRAITTQPISELDPTRVTELMAGRELARADQLRPPRPASRPVPALGLDAVSHEPYFRDVTLAVGKGEIVGLAGLVGSGRSRLARTIAGAASRTAGTIRLHDKAVHPRSVGHALRLGIALLPENRSTEGLVLGRSAAENIAMMALQTALTRLGVIRRRAYRDLVERSISQLEVKPTRSDLPVRAFSGGNQQKLALAKVLAARAQIVVLDQPTAGVDVITKAQLHGVIRSLASEGIGILLISDDLDELLALSHRVAVMRAGMIIHTADTDATDRTTLLHLATVGRTT